MYRDQRDEWMFYTDFFFLIFLFFLFVHCSLFPFLKKEIKEKENLPSHSARGGTVFSFWFGVVW